MDNRQSCGVCKIKKATWVYMPSTSIEENPYFCDDCVPRGCSCNNHTTNVNDYYPPLDSPEIPDGEENIDWKWLSETTWTYIDKNGREYPCCEFDHDEDGWMED